MVAVRDSRRLLGLPKRLPKGVADSGRLGYAGDLMLEYVQQPATGATRKLLTVTKYEDLGFSLKKERPLPDGSSLLIFAKEWSPNEIMCSDLPIGGVKFTVSWPYQDSFKALATARGLDLIIGPNDNDPELVAFEYVAEITRNEAEEFLSEWQKVRKQHSDETESILYPLGHLSSPKAGK